MANTVDNKPITPDEYYDTIRVEDYYDKVHRATWARRVSGALAGATLGIVSGAAIGVVAAFIPPVLGALGIAAAVAMPTMAAIGAMAGMMAGAGAFVGILMNTDVGSNAASVAAGLEEYEKRERRSKLQEANLNQDGAAQKVATENLSDPNAKKVPKLFSWKVAAITGTLGVIFGAVVSLNPIAASAAALLGAKAGTLAGAISSGAVFGMFASMIGIKNSYITNKTNNFYFKIITEQYFSKDKTKEAQPQVAAQPKSQDEVIAESIIREAKFADKQKRFSVNSIISGEKDCQETTITR